MSRWQLVQELFEETAALAPEERARILSERSRGEEEIVRQVEALVAADATVDGKLDRNALELLIELRDVVPAEDLCGTSFGAYRIEEHISSGGMGHVYRATRTKAGTERRVALKALRPGLDARAFLERFERERRTLAALEHEHIVTFLDAGTLPDGRPYLAMEYVEGMPLTEWGRGQPLRTRIELFLRVLAAVQYAHQKLVVHRDLKPSNVLVTAQGAPKLLDFGVATVLEPEGSANDGRAPLTPSYASPEELRGEPATTASDVYSLGVLLNELVTGERRGSDDEKPAQPRSIARFGADLNAIVGCALAPNPGSRYGSADHMASDLRRYVAGEPISARPSTWSYRTSLFARRHRWRLASAAAILVALAAGWVGSDLDRRRAEGEASIGWGAHAQAKLVARLFEGWIASATATDNELSADATSYLEAALQDPLASLPEAETLVRLTLARLYLERGERERASVHAERAWELSLTTRGVSEREREQAAELRERLR